MNVLNLNETDYFKLEHVLNSLVIVHSRSSKSHMQTPYISHELNHKKQKSLN